MTDRTARQRFTAATTKAVCAFVSATTLTAAVGCTSLPKTTGLPEGARLVAETPDLKSGFTALEDGTIYIYTRGSTSFLRYSGPIKKDAVFTIDPETNSATVDGKKLEVTVPGGGGNHYQVFFRPASLSGPDGLK